MQTFLVDFVRLVCGCIDKRISCVYSTKKKSAFQTYDRKFKKPNKILVFFLRKLYKLIFSL